jgi:plasmid maintenance system antidote protein VapI
MSNETPYALRKKRVMNPVTKVTTIQPKTNLSLPQEVQELLKTLDRDELISYCRVLKEVGWTLESMAQPINLSRERVRQYVKQYPHVSKDVSHLPVPQLPIVEVVREVHEPKVVPQELADRLKELQQKAYWVRGKANTHRKEAEEYTELLYDVIENQGYSYYQVAKAIGVTHGAIAFRLVRYGYKTTNGKSRAYRQLTHRVTEEN